jgi:hypothetical protein
MWIISNKHNHFFDTNHRNRKLEYVVGTRLSKWIANGGHGNFY